MILIHPPDSVRSILEKFIYEPADATTASHIKAVLDKVYGNEVDLKINVGYDYNEYLFVRFEFETEEDAVIFKLRYGQ